jgi:hypothetical protein
MNRVAPGLDRAGALENSTSEDLPEKFRIAGEETAAVGIAQHDSEPEAFDRQVD